MSVSDYLTNPLVMLAYSLRNRKSRTRHLDFLRDMDKSQFYNSEQLQEMQKTDKEIPMKKAILMIAWVVISLFLLAGCENCRANL